MPEHTTDESRPIFGKYGRIDNLARAVTHGHYAVGEEAKMYSQNYGALIKDIEEVVSAAISETREYAAHLCDDIAAGRRTATEVAAMLRNPPSFAGDRRVGSQHLVVDTPS